MQVFRSLFLSFFVFSPLLANPLIVNTHAEGAILYNPDTQKILYEKNIHDSFYPASTTKIVTAAWALKLKGDKLNQIVSASNESLISSTEESKRKSGYTQASWGLVPGTSHMGIKKGEEIPFKDLLSGMMVVSAGDAANVIAEFAGGSIPRFVEGMNAWVKSIGCKNTYFENPHGLFHPNQVTTPFDMAIIMKEAMKHPYFKEIIAKTSFSRPKTNKQAGAVMAQTNRLIRPGPFYYSKAIGGKTGYLSSALNTYVAAAKDKDRTLIAVFFKTKERNDLWKDSIQLFDRAFSESIVENVFMKAGIQDFTLEEKGFEVPLAVTLNEEAKLSYYPAEAPKACGLVFWDTLILPVQKGEKVGQLQIVDEKNIPLKAYTLYAANDVKGTLFHRINLFLFPSSIPMLLFRWVLILFIIAFLVLGLKKVL